MSVAAVFIGFAFFVQQVLVAAEPPERDIHLTSGFATDNISRPLRYWPVGTDFVITNGAEFFNRPLYGGSSPFRADGGDKPEFSLYLPGRGGNLRLGLKSGSKIKWLNDAAHVVAIYRPGSIIHEIRDPLLGDATLRLTALAPREVEALIVQAEIVGAQPNTELVWAFGGVNGMKGRRDGDIGCEKQPVAEFFQLRPDQCAGNKVNISQNEFSVTGQPGTIRGVVSQKAAMQIADAADWNRVDKIFSPATNIPNPILAGHVALKPGQPFYLALQRLSAKAQGDEPLAVYREVAQQSEKNSSKEKPAAQISSADLPKLFGRAESARRALAERVAVETPDPFVNASAAALNVAADAVWDDRQEAYLHGGVAWRVRLLGWRVSYAGDELGWHERTAKHFAGFATFQNTNEISAELPSPEKSANLSRNETALHSNGDLSKSHYDMNLVAVDAFFRHLLWTGDRDYAKKMWPVIERHLAWERRLFRREFGDEKQPLYEAYCCIWASDDLAYNGGGATHSSAYNYYHNVMAARVAKWIDQDPTPYELEAELILRGLKNNLWLADCGWFAEWKDLLGLQLVHSNAAVWTFYHTVDSEVPTPMEAWQMTRFVDTQLAHIPLQGADVPTGNVTLPTTSWLPYTWSLNNVVLAETMHTSLAYWQAGRPEGAFPLFKGALLDSMYLGLCPGNVGMCTFFDANRRESQRDFGDGSGAMSRALVEGLFGVKPDLLAGEIKIQPGFPAEWNYATMRHPDFQFQFRRDGTTDTYSFTNHFSKPLKLVLQVPALREDIASLTVNGKQADWKPFKDAVGKPVIEITADAAVSQKIEIRWSESALGGVVQTSNAVVNENEIFSATLRTDELLSVVDPQHALGPLTIYEHGFKGQVVGTPGQRTVFAQVRQGAMTWWQPVTFEIQRPQTVSLAVDWAKTLSGKFETMDLAAQFNDRVTQIFKNEYLAPRSPFCSLATPQQGFGSWCHPKVTFEVNDAGLRSVAAKNGGKIILPNGVPLATPGVEQEKNIAFVSQWKNYPREISVPLAGKSSHAFLLMAGSTTALQSRFDSGEVIVTYADGSTAKLPLRNPTTWWPMDQDYYFDDFAFRQNLSGEPTVALPPRVDLATGKIRVLNLNDFKGKGRTIPGGAATVLDLPLDSDKELKSITVRAIANEVVIGLMSVTLLR